MRWLTVPTAYCSREARATIAENAWANSFLNRYSQSSYAMMIAAKWLKLRLRNGNRNMKQEPVDLFSLDLDNFHHIQREILARLYIVASATYSELKDPGLTGNSFNYHLRHV